MPSILPRVEAVSVLGDRRAAWDELVEALPLPTPFLRSWWLEAVADRYTSYLLVLDADGTLVGGLPVQVRRRLGVSLVRVTGSGPLCPDHLDAVSAPGRTGDVCAALDSWLRRQGHVLLDLDGLVERSTLGGCWGPASPLDVAPYRTLTTREDYVNGLSTSRRRALKRAHRKLTALDVRHRSVDGDRLIEALRAFRLLQEDRQGRRHLVDNLQVLDAALVAGHARGEVRVDVLERPDRVVAVMIAFLVADRISLYQVARSTERDDDGAGNVLLHEVFQDASTRGWREIDLLRGAEEYKYKFVDQTRQLWRIRRAFGTRARAVLGLWRLASAGRATVAGLRQRFDDVSGRTRRLTAP